MYDAEDYLIRQAFAEALKSEEATDFLKKLAEAPAEPEPRAPDVSPAEPVTYYFEERLSRRGQTVEGLRGELDARRDLHHRFAEEIDYQISRAAFSLKEFHFWGIGYNRGVDMKRNLLERQLAEFRHKRRQEELRFWEDVVALRRQLRDAQREYTDALRRAKLVETSR